MSGVFKSFERIVPQAVFQNNQHKLRLHFRFARYNPASYYFNPAIRNFGLPQSHELDLDQLSLIHYSLLRQTNNFQNLVPQLSGNQAHQTVLSELEEEISKNNFALDSIYNSIRVQLAYSKGQNLTVDSATSLIYSLAHKGKAEELKQILPSLNQLVLQPKLKYASDQNLYDLVQGLAKAEIYDPAIWKSVLQTISSKVWGWEYQPVELHGWETGIYEKTESSPKAKQAYAKNVYQYYLNQASSGSAQIASLKKQLCQIFSKVLFYAIYPIYHREKRILYNFDCVDNSEEKNNFFNTLQSLDGKVEGVANVLQNLRSKQQTY